MKEKRNKKGKTKNKKKLLKPVKIHIEIKQKNQAVPCHNRQNPAGQQYTSLQAGLIASPTAHDARGGSKSFKSRA